MNLTSWLVSLVGSLQCRIHGGHEFIHETARVGCVRRWYVVCLRCGQRSPGITVGL